MVNTINIFIGHSWNYDNHYSNLEKLLNNVDYFSWKNYSVPKDDPIHNAPNTQLLKEAIKKQMQYSHVVVVLAGVYASYSKWIDIEMQLAREMKKPILAIDLFGSERSSQEVKQHANKTVKWSTDSIVAGIRELSST